MAVTPLIVAMLLSVTIGVTAALMAWRERPEPGAVPLTAMLIGQSIWSCFFVFELQAATLPAKVFWSNVQWIGVVIIPVAWLVFSLEYTGNDRYVTRRTLAALSVVPVLTVVLAVTEQHHQILYLDSLLVQESGMPVLHRVGGPWYWVIAGYTYLLGVVGAVPLLELVRSDTKPFRGQSAALLIGILTPWTINAVFLLGFSPVEGFDPTPIGFAISGLAYLWALRRFRLFGTSPAPTQGAHRLVFERMQEGAIVVDSHDYVVDMNDNVADVLGVDPRETLGRPARHVIPGYGALPEQGRADEYVSIDGESGPGFYDVTVTRVTDHHDRVVGKVITFHDVGQHLREQQRLEVFNRVLRHNIRTETTLVCGYLEEYPEAGEAALEKAKAHALRIEQLSEQARTIADIFDREEHVAVPLDRVIDRSVDAVHGAYPSVCIVQDPLPAGVHVSSVFRSVFENIVENAAEHNTNEEPKVRIHGEREGGRVTVVVEDNGPGITDYERTVLERGTETPLQHGSGLGLWLIKWGTQIAGGEVKFGSREPTGSVIRVTAPILTMEEPSDGEPAIM